MVSSLQSSPSKYTSRPYQVRQNLQADADTHDHVRSAHLTRGLSLGPFCGRAQSTCRDPKVATLATKASYKETDTKQQWAGGRSHRLALLHGFC